MSVVLYLFGIIAIVGGFLLFSSILLMGAGASLVASGVMLLAAGRGLELLNDIERNSRRTADLLDNQFNPKDDEPRLR